jgi:hypothetical protein
LVAFITALITALVVLAAAPRTGVGVPPLAWLFWIADCSTAIAPALVIPVIFITANPPPVEVPGAWVKTVEFAAPIKELRTNTLSVSTLDCPVAEVILV